MITPQSTLLDLLMCHPFFVSLSQYSLFPGRQFFGKPQLHGLDSGLK